MLRRLLKYFAILTLIILSAGCSDDLAPELVAGGDGVLTITLKNNKGTRSTESNNNEIAISNLVIALYTSESSDDDPAVFLETFSNLDARSSYTVNMLLTDDMISTLFNNTSGSSCRIFAVANIDNLRAVSQTASVNSLKSMSISSPFSTVKAPQSFVMSGEDKVVYSKEEGASKGSAEGSVLVYRTAAKISLNISLPESVDVKDDQGNVVETWIPVTNSSNGIVVLLNNGVDKCVVSPSDDWTPNGNGSDDYYFNMSFGNSDVFRSLQSATNPTNQNFPYEIDVPLYTYPNTWQESPEETHKTVMTLRVPWQKKGESNYVTYYYQVPVTDTESIVSNNHYIVNLSVNMLGSLSPETPEDITDLSYKIVNWGSEDIDVDINDYRYLVVNPTSYNVYNEKEFQLPFYTSHPVEITSVSLSFDRFNFYSNGNGEIVTFTIGQDVLNRSVYEHRENNVTVRDTLCTASLVRNPTNNQLSLRVSHPLEIWTAYNSQNNEVTFTNKANTVTAISVQNQIQRFVRPTTPQSPYSAYTITVVIQHADNPNFKETVTIKQYPGVYIEADHNEGGQYATGYSGYQTINGVRHYNTTYSENGFVFVNPTWTEPRTTPNAVYPGYWTNDDDLGGLKGLTGNNKNPNMYIITLSQLNEDDAAKYIIGDPRMTNVNNNLSGTGNLTTGNTTAFTSCVTADALYEPNTRRKLTYYLPTMEGSANSDYAKMIAPKFRVASSYGVLGSSTTHIGRVAGRRRVATYQEQGCPAGRWRLPTLAELQYIVTLSYSGIIPTLFNNGATYLTAQGPYTIGNGGTLTASSNTEYFVRGVYDEWYWSQFDDQYQLQKNTESGYDFTFGDLPRKLSGD